jgi:hypothetical protein
MKKFLIASVAVLGVMGIAEAHDLPSMKAYRDAQCLLL